MTFPLSHPGLDQILAGLVDYAGLFPPAGLSMPAAAAHYAGYRKAPERWALGRFIVPAARLPELTATLAESLGDGWGQARLSVIAGAERSKDLRQIADFNQRWEAEDVLVDSLETRLSSVEEVDAFQASLPRGLTGYGEIPLGPLATALVRRLGDVGLSAKVRLGGVNPDQFPDPVPVADFLIAVAERKLPFKATAGLHHPLRGQYRLTYDPGSAVGPMYGYLNIILATLVALNRGNRQQVTAALVESQSGTILFDEAGLAWGDWRFDHRALKALRVYFQGFGSCSFREPMDELEPALTR